MKNHRHPLVALVLLCLCVGVAQAKRDMYEQDPGFRGIEFGSQPSDVMRLVDDSEAPIRVYERKTDSEQFGYAKVELPKYYFHDELGFYKATIDFDAGQVDGVIEELKTTFGPVTQVLPMGSTDLMLWLRADHQIELTRAKQGKSSLKVVSTMIGPELGE